MCSSRCAKPERPGRSLREPTSYHTSTETTGVEWSSEQMTRRPFGSVNCSNAIRPACAESAPGMIMSNTNSWRMGSGLRGEKRERVDFEDSPLLLVRERQCQELIDVLPKVFHAWTGPVGTPQHRVHKLGQARKVVQQVGRRNARDVEPDFPMTSQDKERLLHVQRPPAMRHHQLQIGEIDGDVVQLHRVAVLRPGARKDRRAGVDQN